MTVYLVYNEIPQYKCLKYFITTVISCIESHSQSDIVLMHAGSARRHTVLLWRASETTAPHCMRDKDGRTAKRGHRLYFSHVDWPSLPRLEAAPSLRREPLGRFVSPLVYRPSPTRHDLFFVCADSPNCAIQHHKVNTLID